jgi:photosystem II stability/assembly factor-like uncharacterized protein
MLTNIQVMRKKHYQNRLIYLVVAALCVCVALPLPAQQKAPQTALEKAFELNDQMISLFQFRSIGPAAYSGRISDLAVNPNNHSEYYVGVASGGLWKTTNHGTTFQPIFDDQPVFSIGCLAMDPNNANVLWVGTGENNSQRNLAYGDGVYKTSDGGKSFTNMGLKTSSQIGKIMIDPRNSQVVYVAAQGQAWGPGGERGLYKTIDGGQTWRCVLEISEYTGVSDMEMDPRNPDILYAAAHQRERRVYSKINGGPESAIYKSTDAGRSWVKLKKGLPSGDVGRIGLALSPANPDILYAVIELPGNKGGLYRSCDMGESWEKRSDKVSGSPQYYNELYADPVDPDLIILMDTRNALSEDGGKTWINIEGKNKHVDNHALWINPDDTKHYLVGCDGGLYETYDRGQTWQFMSNLPITQYYHVRTDNQYPFYNVYGGTQDNGSWFGPSQTNRHYLVNADWTYTIGGDGYLSIPDPNNSNISYHESQYCGIRRYDHTTGNSVSIKPQPTIDEEYRWNWNTPYLLSHFDSKTLYIGGNYVLKSTDMGNSWTKISEDLTRQIDQNSLPMMDKMWPPEAVAKNMSTSKFGNIFALAESPLKQGMLYAGTDDGLIWVTQDDGSNWIRYERFDNVPEMTFVNYLLPSMHHENTVYACFDGRKNSSDFTPYLLKSTDNGQSWESIANNLPSGTVYCIQEDHINPDILFIGTEWGVWTTIDGGHKWVQIKNGIPPIQVKELTIQRRENDLVVSTFGRGFYVLDDYSALRELNETITQKSAHLFKTNETLLYFPSSNLNNQGEVHFRTPNPKPAVKFEYFIKEGYETLKQKRVKAQKEALKNKAPYPYPSEEEVLAEKQEEQPSLVFTIYDDQGQIMRKLSTSYGKGYKQLTWDMAYLSSRGPKVPPGEYQVTIDKKRGSMFTRLVEASRFTIKSLPNALGTPNYAANFEFMKGVMDLNAQLTACNAKIEQVNTRLKNLTIMLDNLPVEAHLLVDQIRQLQRESDTIAKALVGGFGAKNTAISRLRFTSYAAYSAQVDITGTQKEQYNLAKSAYNEQAERLDQLFDEQLPALEKDFQEAGGILFNVPSGRSREYEE